ncbi:MAG: protease HtpX [Deltaproteobacteria bacterium]|nr:protease HtpX [Deltaproteobacteria bacterium]
MAWIKRIFLFAVVNILVVLTLSTLLSVLGVHPYLSKHYGIDYQSLAIFCLVWGMGGALISLALSRVMAKWIMGVQVIDPSQATGEWASLVQRVHRLAQAAGFSTMPQVGVYQSEELNAFATGPTRSRALVAVSTGLLRRMEDSEVDGVLGHEITHIANGDMVTMTLLQGILNAFVMFLARVIAFAVSQNVKEESRYWVRFLVTFVLEMTLSLFGFLVLAAFSRWREYRADKGGATLAGRQNMISALQALQRYVEIRESNESPAIANFKISGKTTSFLSLLATHPPLEQRIERLRQYL